MHPEIIWKDVVGYEGLYKVSNTGDILSIKRKGNWRGDHLMTKTNDGLTFGLWAGGFFVEGFDDFGYSEFFVEH